MSGEALLDVLAFAQVDARKEDLEHDHPPREGDRELVWPIS